MKPAKSTIELAQLDSAISSLVQAIRTLKDAGEPALLMRVSGLLKECRIKRVEAQPRAGVN